MTIGKHSQGGSLQTWSPVLFLAAGGVLLVYAGTYGLEVLGGARYPGLQEVLLASGYAIGFVGLLGLYPGNRARVPVGARVATGAGAVALVGWLALLAAGVGEVAMGSPTESDVLPGAFFVAHPVTMVLAYGLFAVAILRRGFHSRTAGRLLLVPPTLVVALLVGGIVYPGEFPLGAFVISTGQGMAHMAVGYALRTGSDSSGPGGRSREGPREVSAND